MTAFVPRASRLAARSRRTPGAVIAAADRSRAAVNVEQLAGLVPTLRHRLAIPPALGDEAIIASLATIASHTSYEQRWRAGESSTLGLFLQSHGRNLRSCLVTLLSLLPRP